ncbi:potassium channel subfamily K member 5-like [Rhopilema esculentum]|uniref:potassium channel subfamily K member 5-like n=1 Tax=Rhopilema esculentum TaxID=499914 RepID=UPI0031D2357A
MTLQRCMCCVCCCRCCKTFWCQILGITLRSFPIVILELIGWALFSYVEDNLHLKYCFSNTNHVADKLYPQGNETKKATELFTRLYHKTKLLPSNNQSVVIYALFQFHFKVPPSVPLSKEILGGLGCLRWYRFSAMTMTTIGFGGVTPRTTTGKLLTIPYALVTIPAMLSFLAYVGSVVSSWVENLMLCVHRLIKGNKPLRYKLVKRVIYMYIVVWIAGLLFAADFIFNSLYFQASSQESWINALYFAFVTFSTIGFGDISEPANDSKFYGLTLIVGLASFSGFADSILAASSRVKFGFKKNYTFYFFHYIEDEELAQN